MILPPWAPSLRPNQFTAINDILSQFTSDIKVVFCEAPTGSGKTLIAEMVRQELDCRGIYLCSSISLQQQYMRDFPDAALLMGRSNYPTEDYSDLFGTSFSSVTCSDCTKKKVDGVLQCRWCSQVSLCPYEIAKRYAAKSAQVCSNTWYYFYECNHPGTKRNRQLVVIDECDGLENILMSYVEVSFSARMVEDLHLPTPKKKTVEDSWYEWAIESNNIISKEIANLREPGFTTSIQDLKRYQRTHRAAEDIKRLCDPEIGISSGGWVYTGYGSGNLQFKPIKVDRYAKEYLWQHGLRFLLMSATIISTQEMADSLGLEG